MIKDFLLNMNIVSLRKKRWPSQQIRVSQQHTSVSVVLTSEFLSSCGYSPYDLNTKHDLVVDKSEFIDLIDKYLTPKRSKQRKA